MPARRRPSPRPSRSASGLAALEHGPLAVRRAAFERYFQRVLPTAPDTPRQLAAGMRYAALSPGKRLRPLLVLTACEAVGAPWRRALPAAVAAELVHAFSLVHDDLPAMDDDDYRRGRLTTHKKFGEAMGVLVGDALFAQAFMELGRLVDGGVPWKSVVRAMAALAIASGSQWLIGGQVLDVEAEGRPATRDRVEDIHARKTGALISASMSLGAIVAGATAEAEHSLGIAGFALGSAFQIRDDLLNEESSLRKLGKRAGSDAARGKATFPRAVGRERAETVAALEIDMALARVRAFGRPARHLERLILATAARDR